MSVEKMYQVRGREVYSEWKGAREILDEYDRIRDIYGQDDPDIGIYLRTGVNGEKIHGVTVGFVKQELEKASRETGESEHVKWRKSQYDMLKQVQSDLDWDARSFSREQARALMAEINYWKNKAQKT